jgi:2-keto-4-pentenoate hydratase
MPARQHRHGLCDTGPGEQGAEPTCAPVAASAIVESGATFDAARFHGLALEVEFAFRLKRDLPPRDQAYRYEEVVDAVDFVPLIEIVGSRYRDRTGLSVAEQLADANANGAFVLGKAITDWRSFDFMRQRVELAIDGTVVQSAMGTHPAGDPLKLVVWQANHLTGRNGGLRSGAVVTTGSLQGMTPAGAGSRSVGDWGSWGRVEVAFRNA